MPELTQDSPLNLREADFDSLADGYKQWIEQVESVRADRMRNIWEKAAKNYDGKAPMMTLPWRGAANAVLNITQSHTDSIQARLYHAGANSDPVYLIRESTGEPVRDASGAEICSASKFAQWWQEISKHIETYEVNHKQALEEATWISAIYGDAWIYVSWVKEEVMDATLGPEGELIKSSRVIKDHPTLTVLHPERVYLAPWDNDAQEALTIGFDFDLDDYDLQLKEKQNVYKKSRVDLLREMMPAADPADGGPVSKALAGAGTFKEWGRESGKSELRALLDEQAGIDPAAARPALKMIKIFQRVDLDGDGVPEEIQFEVEKESGTVAMARYSNLQHRRRPLVHLYYQKRPGSPYNIGVPEILFNAQKILNNLIRDLLNNNKVKNTKLFLSKVGSPIKKQSEIFPSRLLQVRDVDKDFKVLDLGSSGGVTGLSEIGLVQQWAERLTGVQDANLGIQAKSRTPVGTTQALIEEGSKRLDRVIDRQAEAQAEMWAQILCLYRQNGDPRKLAEWARIEEGDMDQFLLAWDAVKPEDFTSYLRVKPQVSSNSFNRAAQKQEVLTVMGQVQHYYEQLLLLANQVGAAMQAGDQQFAQLVLSMAEGGHELMQKFLSLHDVKEQDNLNPKELIELLKGVTSVGTGEGGGTGNPAEAAAGAANSGADLGEAGEAPGRPSPGLPRVPAEPGGPAPEGT